MALRSLCLALGAAALVTACSASRPRADVPAAQYTARELAWRSPQPEDTRTIRSDSTYARRATGHGVAARRATGGGPPSAGGETAREAHPKGPIER